MQALVLEVATDHRCDGHYQYAPIVTLARIRGIRTMLRKPTCPGYAPKSAAATI
jgi:hypothetical protein